jgi:outer membrane protein assembly factor BamB/ABC-type phosphate/phosphonate transport system substrate-binding protein
VAFLLRIVTLAVALAAVTLAQTSAQKKPAADPLVLIVLDPLSRELACACVKGFGQRDYRKLSGRLQEKLNQRVSIEFSDDLADTVELLGPGREFLVIGDRSQVTHAATKAKLKLDPVCELSDRDGSSTLAASFVVRSDDSARELKDLAGRKVLMGLAQTDERFALSQAALRDAGIEPPKPEKHLIYTDAALDLLDSEATPLPFAVVPSYALVMLQGCGSVKPGNLKVIGQTRPAPFITAFLSSNIPAERKRRIVTELLAVQSDPKLLEALETKEGFRPLSHSKTASAPGTEWPDWRGPNRDGRVPHLPTKLPGTMNLVWKKPAMNGALAGITVSQERVILAERDFGDENDVFRCLDAGTGELLWRLQFPARGRLDYGQAPRATPVVHGSQVFLLSAFGDLRCVNLADGAVLWHRNLIREFQSKVPTWGLCSPPLVVDDLLIVNPGGSAASLAALDRATGATRWTSPGLAPGYSAFIHAEFGGRPQIIGYDERTLGGWDPKNGKRLWQIVPPTEGDFNVPTPIAVPGGLVVTTENNGTRLYTFNDAGKPVPKPLAEFADLAADTTTPVLTSGRIFGAAHGQLFCLDAQTLKLIWKQKEDALGDHVTLLADDNRVLVVTIGGELILLDAKSEHCSTLSRLKLFDSDVEVYSHPALVGTRLYARGGYTILCADLGAN